MSGAVLCTFRKFLLLSKQARKYLLIAQHNISKICPGTMKIDSPQFKELFTPELETLAQLFKRNGYELRIAGGAVRDLLLDKKVHDLDFCTSANVLEMKKMFSEEGVRMVNERGERHGTVTPYINDKQTFEVTMLMTRDIESSTEGQPIVRCKPTTDWSLDAGNRDLTINSLYLGLDGTVYDYNHGIDDLDKRRIVFVGDPVSRIREDYIRILRYFRFFSRLSTDAKSHDAAALEAIRQEKQGLQDVPAERVWTEFKKILDGTHAKDVLLVMIELGLTKYLGFPDELDINQLNESWERMKDLNPNPVTILVSLLSNSKQILTLHTRLRLSTNERDLGLFLLEFRNIDLSNGIRPIQALVVEGKNQNAVKFFGQELLKFRGERQLAEEFDNWECPKFPLTGYVLVQRGVQAGKDMGKVITLLRSEWIESNFTLTEDELVARINDVRKQLEDKRTAQKSAVKR